MKRSLFTALLLLSLVGVPVFMAQPALAQGTKPVKDCQKNGGTPTSIDIDGTGGCIPDPGTNIDNNPIVRLLKTVIKFMSAGVGLVVVGGIIYGGILYAWSRDNAAQTKQAMDIIRNTVIGLILYMGMFAILNFLIPGGVFN